MHLPYVAIPASKKPIQIDGYVDMRWTVLCWPWQKSLIHSPLSIVTTPATRNACLLNRKYSFDSHFKRWLKAAKHMPMPGAGHPDLNSDLLRNLSNYSCILEWKVTFVKKTKSFDKTIATCNWSRAPLLQPMYTASTAKAKVFRIDCNTCFSGWWATSFEYLFFRIVHLFPGILDSKLIFSNKSE